MKLNNFTLFILLFLIFSANASDYTIIRFELNDSIKKLLKESDFDVTGINYNTLEIEALLNSEELKIIQQSGANIKFSYPESLVVGPDDEYKSPQEIEDYLRKVHAQYPNITSLQSIGKTLEGGDILALKISDNPNKDEVEPVVLVNSMHHAREVMTPEIALDMIDYLTSNYEKKSQVTSWVNETEIWVLPMLNLDGNKRVWKGNYMWRKNTRNGYGVDLNRNYPTGWKSCRGSSGSIFSQTYRGPEAASEPETQAMMNFVAKIKPVFNISYHSYSELVIYPFGCRPKKTPQEEMVETIGKEVAEKLNYKPGTAWELLYNADGGDIDWMYTEHQVIPYVIEVSSTNEGFQPDYHKWRDITVARNRPGWMHLLQKLQGPLLQGRISRDEYEVIKIFNPGEATPFQTYKINPDGSYFIVLKAGTYDVLFEGAKQKRVENLEVTSKVYLK